MVIVHYQFTLLLCFFSTSQLANDGHCYQGIPTNGLLIIQSEVIMEENIIQVMTSCLQNMTMTMIISLIIVWIQLKESETLKESKRLKSHHLKLYQLKCCLVLLIRETDPLMLAYLCGYIIVC